jgi:multidrug efflux pump
MNISADFSVPFIKRPVATTLLTAAIFLAGALAFNFLPEAPLPQVDFPTIYVNANLPGASPETMASSVATPLERQFSRIAGVTEMTSSSSMGSTGIALQFDLNRNIDAAGRDVQAAINAARSQLPSNLPGNPEYWKTNPADAPVLMLGLTSRNFSRGQVFDAADSIIAQKVAQIKGVGQVEVWGGAQPAVRVDVNPTQISSYGISLEQVRAALATANAHSPTGSVEDADRTVRFDTTDQLFLAKEYQPLIVTWVNGAPVRLGDIATVTDSVSNTRNDGISNGENTIMLAVFRSPGANIIDTVDHVRAELPILQASISPSIHVVILQDRSPTIRASVHDVEITLLISIVLVVLVVFAFLRSVWATAIPSIAVPLSLVGTFGAMYLLGYSIDNLSLMALTVSTGFVVDDAIVVIENISRHLESGMRPFEAAIQGAREIGFTVFSMSTSLVAVFLPILLMGGIVGRLFREFAVTLTIAISVSLLVSLTTTPMMCARFLRRERGEHGRAYRIAERSFLALSRLYDRCLRVVLQNQPAVLAMTLLTVALNVYMFIIVPKGFFPQQDTGRLSGAIVGDQATSFAAMDAKMRQFEQIVRADQSVETVTAFAGGGSDNSSRMFAQLKELRVRKASSEEVIARLREKLAVIPGATLYLQSVQDVRVGGRGSNSEFQYTLQSENLDDLYHWAPLLLAQLSKIPELRDVNSDQQVHGLAERLAIDRDTAARLGVSMSAIDNTLNDAFGQRQVSNIYKGLNQYHVVLDVAPEYQENPDALKLIYVASKSGAMVPLSALAHYAPASTALDVNHQQLSPAVTLSFSLAQGASLGQAVQDITTAEAQIHMPPTVQGSFQGTAQAFQDSTSSEPILILAALGSVYIVLGILYESFIHPITILSTLPSAGVGALLAIFLFKEDLNVISMIGIILLIGIVKKNAILMIDFAVSQERVAGKSPVDAIYEACLLRFRPIMMTTMAAMLGALPLAIGGGTGAELRRPLGITIVGGLIVSQMLTLFTTPVVYLYLDRVQTWLRHFFRGGVLQDAHE